jgi:AraC family transcriptional regulator
MFNVSLPTSGVISSPDGLSPRCCNEALVQLLVAATATLESDRDAAKACIQRAVALLQDSASPKGHRRDGFPALRGGLAPWRAKRVAAYVEANIDSNFRVANLAGVVQLSISHFSRAFRRTFGVTPRVYITTLRMRRAQVIMLSSLRPISQIAIDCGMSDQAHFTRVFRKVVGTNPGRWRRQFPAAGACVDGENDALGEPVIPVSRRTL